MKTRITREERWPVYDLTNSETEAEVELPESKIAEYKAISANFHAMQDDLAELWHSQVEQ